MAQKLEFDFFVCILLLNFIFYTSSVYVERRTGTGRVQDGNGYGHPKMPESTGYP